MNSKQEKKLSTIYFNPEHPGSFGGVRRLMQHGNINSRKITENFLLKEPTYNLHKQRFNKFLRRKVNVHEKNYTWQADLIFMKKYSKYNEGFKYILTVIDVFSRFAFAVPLKNKTTKVVIEALEKTFKSGYGKPKFLQCDMGTEFFSNSCKTFLKKYDIKLFHNYSDFKACLVERYKIK